ncbi:hypothetical protein [Nocardia tenerifensis]|uniref:hypothetical protein n=1 Tax=Nocardia tenerifensis TaxID=228006 RepID=UPI0011B52D46|nr:hypothetical protein [Nocardia tenerifensis]
MVTESVAVVVLLGVPGFAVVTVNVVGAVGVSVTLGLVGTTRVVVTAEVVATTGVVVTVGVITTVVTLGVSTTVTVDGVVPELVVETTDGYTVAGTSGPMLRLALALRLTERLGASVVVTIGVSVIVTGISVVVTGVSLVVSSVEVSTIGSSPSGYGSDIGSDPSPGTGTSAGVSEYGWAAPLFAPSSAQAETSCVVDSPVVDDDASTSATLPSSRDSSATTTATVSGNSTATARMRGSRRPIRNPGSTMNAAISGWS